MAGVSCVQDDRDAFANCDKQTSVFVGHRQAFVREAPTGHVVKVLFAVAARQDDAAQVLDFVVSQAAVGRPDHDEVYARVEPVAGERKGDDRVEGSPRV
jgi:hypothetical protein